MESLVWTWEQFPLIFGVVPDVVLCLLQPKSNAAETITATETTEYVKSTQINQMFSDKMDLMNFSIGRWELNGDITEVA